MEMFNDVYAGPEPWTIKEQRDELRSFIKHFPQEYSTEGYAAEQ